ncbi:hypothetical protein J6590_054996 [Homalodisca vitripennis]|nr:hypothetical protein J6590_054996 [Homalodisca vitripennis]
MIATRPPCAMSHTLTVFPVEASKFSAISTPSEEGCCSSTLPCSGCFMPSCFFSDVLHRPVQCTSQIVPLH